MRKDKYYWGYMNLLAEEFGKKHNIRFAEAKAYLRKFGGYAFINAYFRQINSLSVEETVHALAVVCRKNGGYVELKQKEEYMFGSC